MKMQSVQNEIIIFDLSKMLKIMNIHFKWGNLTHSIALIPFDLFDNIWQVKTVVHLQEWKLSLPIHIREKRLSSISFTPCEIF